MMEVGVVMRAVMMITIEEGWEKVIVCKMKSYYSLIYCNRILPTCLWRIVTLYRNRISLTTSDSDR